MSEIFSLVKKRLSIYMGDFADSTGNFKFVNHMLETPGYFGRGHKDCMFFHPSNVTTVKEEQVTTLHLYLPDEISEKNCDWFNIKLRKTKEISLQRFPDQTHKAPGSVHLADEPVTSFALTPRCSPRMITLVPGGPSAGEMPVTTGGGLILIFFWSWETEQSITLTSSPPPETAFPPC